MACKASLATRRKVAGRPCRVYSGFVEMANCGMCAHYCPTDAIRLSDDWHLAHPQSEKYAMADHAVVPRVRCTSCGTEIGPSADALMRRAFRGVAKRTEHLTRLCPDCRRAASLEGTMP